MGILVGFEVFFELVFGLELFCVFPNEIKHVSRFLNEPVD